MHVCGTAGVEAAENNTRQVGERSAAASASEMRTPFIASATLTGTTEPAFHFDFGAGEKKPRIVYLAKTVTSAPPVSVTCLPRGSVPAAVTTLWSVPTSPATTAWVQVKVQVSVVSSLELLFESPAGPERVPALHFASVTVIESSGVSPGLVSVKV